MSKITPQKWMAAINIDDYIIPISELHPFGEVNRHTDLYDEIRKIRYPDQDQFDDDQSITKEIDWESIEKICLMILLEKSKDFIICFWLTEAWIHMHGLGGALLGFQLFYKILVQYASILSNQENQKLLELQFGSILWTDNKFPILLLNNIYLPVDYSSQKFSFHDYMRLHSRGEYKQHKLTKEEQEERMMLDKSIEQINHELALQLIEEVDNFNQLILEINEYIEDTFNDHELGFYSITRILSELKQYLKFALPHMAAPSSKKGSVDTKMVNKDHLITGDSSPSGAENLYNNRHEAYQTIGRVAEYLSKIEPHSPSAYLLRRIHSWENKELPEVLDELNVGHSNIEEIYSILGVKKTFDED